MKYTKQQVLRSFPISRDPPEGGTLKVVGAYRHGFLFPISRDPPEGGTLELQRQEEANRRKFPISRDPPEGGTGWRKPFGGVASCFQFLGIPPKGELATEAV